uniref:C1qDC6 n=1 Tax=Sinohyriopsis cumingii TaxID=165450 RepID=A0A223HH94_SINCU|nr:C1qDC6 [Sinohyriopsis cumingii]
MAAWLMLLLTSTMVETAYSCIMAANTQDDVIAFTLGQDDHFHDAHGSTMVFNKVIDVMGLPSHFQTSGVFKCPAEGVYKFQVYSLTTSGKRIWLELYRNEELVASMYGYTPDNYAAAGNAVILFLTEGDAIFVKTRDQYDVMLFGTPDEIYTTFSGVRMPNSGVAASNGYKDDISFSATLSENKVFQQGSTILYNKVLLNRGNGYNIYGGIFTAPVHGIYIFHFFSLADKDSEIWQELYHNNDYVCALYGRTPSEFAAAGNTAIVHLRSGDIVQIKERYNNTVYGQQDQLYSTFSGALIIRESPNIPLSSRMIAFSVGLSTSTVASANSKVMFDQIFINVKHTYNQRTGDFTAPRDGFYEFNVHALGQSGSPIWLELFHNYKYIVSLYSLVPERYGSTGNSAVIRLYSGDVVYVKTRYDRNSALYGGPKNIYCTFSGYLVSSTP